MFSMKIRPGTYPNSWLGRQSALLSGGVLATVLSLGVAGSGFAQSADTVTLRVDGGEDVTGELVAFSDDLFQIKARIGLVAIPAEGVECIGARCPEGTRLETTQGRLVLTTLDGQVVVTGNLIEVVDAQYVLATNIGEMRVDIAKVDCEGAACVTQAATSQSDMSVVLTGASGQLQGILVETLADAYVVDIAKLGVVRISKDAYSCSGPACS